MHSSTVWMRYNIQFKNPIKYTTIYPIFFERAWSITSFSEDWFFVFTFVSSRWRFLIRALGIDADNHAQIATRCLYTGTWFHWDSSVGIATGYGLGGQGIESRWGARFFAHVQTGPGAHPASCTMDSGSFPGVKRPRRGVNHPILLAPRSRKSRAIPLPPSGPSGLLRGTLTLTWFHCAVYWVSQWCYLC
jgi:hypothetical protein